MLDWENALNHYLLTKRMEDGVMSDIVSQESNVSASQSPAFQAIVRDMCGDMKFVGIIGIVIGACYCITIIGALLGVPYIIASIRLREAADGFFGYLDANNFEALQKGFERQKSFFFIIKVLIIISIVFMVLYFIVIFGFIGMETLMNYS